MCIRLYPLVTVLIATRCLVLPCAARAACEKAQADQDAHYHWAQAAKHQQKAAQLDQAIDRYELMARTYRNGSDSSTGVINPQGRRLMVQRALRVRNAFAQQKHEQERCAALHAEFAQTSP
jgi:hypothetical protein